MANDEREEERTFLDGLKARTGRDLEEWMAAIAAQNFSDKNQTIDWLRSQGFAFARASWLERIHSNGGKPIYAHAPAATVARALPRAALSSAALVSATAASPATGDVAGLEKLVSAAKGYRPLYHLLEAEIRKAVPAVVFTARPACISLGAPAEFAALVPHASGLKLGLDLGDRPFDDQLQKAKIKGAGAGVTHMLVVTDARQVGNDLLTLIKTANGRVNP
jgi:hypothetical protein